MPYRRCLGGCKRLIPAEETRCSDCQSAYDREGNEGSYYQTPEWRRLSKAAKQHGDGCDACGSTHYVTAHHVEGRRAGGADDLANVRVLLCGSCHSSYEAAKRAGRETDLTRAVDELAALTASQGG